MLRQLLGPKLPLSRVEQMPKGEGKGEFLDEMFRPDHIMIIGFGLSSRQIVSDLEVRLSDCVSDFQYYY